MQSALPLLVALIAVASLLLSPRVRHAGAFFKGESPSGAPPGLWTLTFSQVTTWIFARSLLNAAILGYYYGVWGTLAYAAYYLSFLSGGAIIDSLRFRHGHTSVQTFLRDRFGRWGSGAYNLVVAIRLVSEVFANLLVIGILFGVTGSEAYVFSIFAVAAVTLVYSMLGGMHASLRTDLLQMWLFIIVLAVLMVLTFSNDQISLSQLGLKPFVYNEPGPVLIAVALLQIWSYPLHDPVMMDRGFMADRATTRRSFLHATWISGLSIGLFGLLGVFAGALAQAGEEMVTVLTRVLGETPMLFFNLALVISAMSTLDSTLTSAAKLVAVDMGWGSGRLPQGRAVMVLFMLLGLALLFLNSQDLFAAVALSGTVSLYLAPVVFFSIWGGRRDIPVWSYVGVWVLALVAGVLQFTEGANLTHWLGEAHKYTKLLYITAAVLIAGNLLFWLGGRYSPRRSHETT